MKPLTFLFTTTFFPPYHIGGDATLVYHLANELAARGHNIHIIYLPDSYRWQRRSIPSVNNYPIENNIHLKPLYSSLGKFSSILTYMMGNPTSHCNTIKKIVAEVRPDIIHHHNIAGFGPWVFKLPAPRKLYTVHDHWLICQLNGLLNWEQKPCCNQKSCFSCSLLSGKPPQLWRYLNYLQYCLSSIDLIISPSSYLKRRLYDHGLQNQIEVLPNFIPKPEINKSNPFPFPYFLFVGVLEKHKGILELIDLFIELSIHSKAKLVVAGNGTLANFIDNKIKDNRCEEFIIRIGRVDNLVLSSLYLHAEAVIIPSQFYENCPMVALEAISHGTPIITSNFGGLPEITSKINPNYIFRNFSELRDIIMSFDINRKKSQNVLSIYDQFYSTKNVDNYLSLIEGM